MQVITIHLHKINYLPKKCEAINKLFVAFKKFVHVLSATKIWKSVLPNIFGRFVEVTDFIVESMNKITNFKENIFSSSQFYFTNQTSHDETEKLLFFLRITEKLFGVSWVCSVSAVESNVVLFTFRK